MDGGKILGGKYFASNMVPVNLNINFAAAICTYRKEEFVERNLRVLKKAILENPESPLYRHLYVFISDNAGSMCGLPLEEMWEAWADLLTVFWKQKPSRKQETSAMWY